MLRQTPLTRKTRLRKVSAKRSALMKEVAIERAKFVNSRECVIALMKGQRGVPASDCHEIVGGSHRQTTLKDRRFWLPVNRFNHQILQYMDRERQWALKALFDPENFEIGALTAFPGFIVQFCAVLQEVANVQCLRWKVRL